MSTSCPHCGRPDAPAADGRIDRHRRADHRPGIDPGNELCLASFTRPTIGEACTHLPPSAHCIGASR